MKIDTGSWHYRFHIWAWGYVPRSLCPYVDRLVLGLLLSPLIAVYHALSWDAQRVFVIASISVGAGLVNYLFLQKWYIAVLAAAIVPLWFLFFWLVDRYTSDSHEEPRPRRPKEPGLLKSWIHAKHRKICPLLEFETA